jgi:NitT/TauT family transport system substrate-binding protein
MDLRARASKPLFLGIMCSVLLLAGCGDSSEPSTDSAPALDKVTYATAFGAAGRDAFAWIAQEKGYFTQQRLNVKIQLGKAAGENLKALAAGQAQFAALDLTGAMLSAHGKGARDGAAYRDFRAVLAIHQQTLVSVMAIKGSGIATPKDLRGKRIAAAANSVNQLLFPGYARLAGIDTTGIRWVAVQPTQLGPVLAGGKADALSTFLIGRPTIEKATMQTRKAPVVVFPYSQYLPDLFGNAIVTTTDLTTGKPDLVKRFREAMRLALVYTVQHPDEAAALLHRKQPATVAAVAAAEITLMSPSVLAEGPDAVGTISRDRMRRAIASLAAAGLIESGLTPEDVVDFATVPAK